MPVKSKEIKDLIIEGVLSPDFVQTPSLSLDESWWNIHDVVGLLRKEFEKNSIKLNYDRLAEVAERNVSELVEDGLVIKQQTARVRIGGWVYKVADVQTIAALALDKTKAR